MVTRVMGGYAIILLDSSLISIGVIIVVCIVANKGILTLISLQLVGAQGVVGLFELPSIYELTFG